MYILIIIILYLYPFNVAVKIVTISGSVKLVDSHLVLSFNLLSNVSILFSLKLFYASPNKNHLCGILKALIVFYASYYLWMVDFIVFK